MVIRFRTRCRMQRRKAQAEYPALTDPEHIQSIQPVRPQDLLDASREIIIDVIGQRGEPVRAVGIAPVDEIHVQAFGQQAADQRTILLQIHHVRPVDQRIDDQQRRAPAGRAIGR